MPENPTDRWPRFEFVTFPEPTGVPYEAARMLVKRGVPKSLFGLYRAASELTLLEDSGLGQLVCFGTTGLYGWVCLDPRTGQVVDLIYVPVATTNLPAGVLRPAWLVNSSLEQFIDSVRVVLNRFPFDSVSMERNRDWAGSDWDDLQNEWDHAADEIEEALRAVDPAAVADPNGFWMTFLDLGVRSGDYMTSEVVGTNDG
jgi:SUKH-4 immunity protein